MLTQSHVKHITMQSKIHVKKNPQKVIALEPDTDQYYILTQQPIKMTFLYYLNKLNFKLILAQTTLMPKMQIFILRNLKHSWNQVLFTKHFDNTMQRPKKLVINLWVNNSRNSSQTILINHSEVVVMNKC